MRKMEYISSNKQGDCIDLMRVIAVYSWGFEDERNPYYRIEFKLMDRTKIIWEYDSAKTRDYDRMEIDRLKREVFIP